MTKNKRRRRRDSTDSESSEPSSDTGSNDECSEATNDDAETNDQVTTADGSVRQAATPRETVEYMLFMMRGKVYIAQRMTQEEAQSVPRHLVHEIEGQHFATRCRRRLVPAPNVYIITDEYPTCFTPCGLAACRNRMIA